MRVSSPVKIFVGADFPARVPGDTMSLEAGKGSYLARQRTSAFPKAIGKMDRPFLADR